MDSKFVLLNMKLSGIKSITKEIELSFSNKILKEEFDNSKYRIKGIFGPNGSGKSSLCDAVKIFKLVMLDSNYMNKCNREHLLENYIADNGKLFIEMIYAKLDENSKIQKIYVKAIELKRQGETTRISRDSLYELKGINLYNKRNIIYELSNGEITSYCGPKREMNFINECLNNIGRNLTLNQFILAHSPRGASVHRLTILDSILDSTLFALNLTTYNDEEINLSYLKEVVENLKFHRYDYNLDLFNKFIEDSVHVSINPDKVDFNNMEEYNNQIINLTNYLKQFLNISVIKTNIEKLYYCNRCFNYLIYNDKRKVLISDESDGIKKLISLYYLIVKLHDGAILFIDDLDINIHDVLLIKLLEYMVMNSNGQLVFTSHNLSPMTMLKSYKDSINFLNNDSTIITWTKSGNADPISQYRKGLVFTS